MMSSDFHESELLAAATKGDVLALERLLLNNYSQIEDHIRQRIPDLAKTHFDATDVLQEVLTQAFRSISSFQQTSDGGFVKWVKTIADNRLCDAVRRIKAKKRGGPFRSLTFDNREQQSSVSQLIDLIAHKSTTVGKLVERREATTAINVGIASLPEDQRFAIRARFFEGQNIEAIAKSMNRSPHAVRGLVYRAQKNLAKMMGRSSKWLTR